MKKEKITLENENELLPALYPIIQFKGKKIRYNPRKHQFEKGDAVKYLMIETGEIKKGVIKTVDFSDPFRIPIYTIGKSVIMNHRVWPNVTDYKKHKADKKVALSKLSRRDKEVLGV